MLNQEPSYPFTVPHQRLSPSLSPACVLGHSEVPTLHGFLGPHQHSHFPEDTGVPGGHLGIVMKNKQYESGFSLRHTPATLSGHPKEGLVTGPKKSESQLAALNMEKGQDRRTTGVLELPGYKYSWSYTFADCGVNRTLAKGLRVCSPEAVPASSSHWTCDSVSGPFAEPSAVHQKECSTGASSFAKQHGEHYGHLRLPHESNHRFLKRPSGPPC